MTATPIKRGRGQPSSFNEALAQRIFDMATEGKTDVQIAKAVGVTKQTFNNWKKQHPDFFASLKEAKNVADELVEVSLYQRACGYSHQELKVFFDSRRGEVVTHEVTKHYPPDPTAMIFWLKNRQSDRWRDQPKDAPADAGASKMTTEQALKVLQDDFATKKPEKVEVEDL